MAALGLVPAGPAAAEEPPALEDCDALLATSPAAEDTASCFYLVAQREGAGGPASRAIEHLAATRPELPWFTFYLGNLRWPRSAEAEELTRRAADRFLRLGDERGEMLARLNRSQLLARLGRPAEARAEKDRAVAIGEASADSALQAWARITRAQQLLDRGQDLGTAYELLRHLEIPQGARNEFSMRRDRLLSLGLVCMSIGRLGEARDAYRRLAEMAEERGDLYLEANARYNLASVTGERHREAPTESRHVETVALAKDALRAAQAADHRTMHALAAGLLGLLLRGEEAAGYLEECIETAEAPDVRSYCMGHLASRVAALDSGRARRLLERARETAEASADGWSEVRVWQEALRVGWIVDPPERALAVSWAALEATERLRDRQSEGSQAQAGLFSVWSDEYSWLAGRILEEAGTGLPVERATSEAFRVQERMRARALTDWLRKAGPGTADAADGEFAGIEEVRARLRPDEALLSFQVAPWEDLAGDFGGGSWLLAVTRDGVAVHRLPGRVELRRDVHLFDGLVEQRDGSDARVAVPLYEEFLAPALAALPPSIDRLILVPDDALHRLPFAALRAAPEAEPLGVRYELVQVPSATLWLDFPRPAAAPPARRLLVLADPDPPGPDGTGGGVVDAPVEVAEVRDAGRALGRLPHARREGRAAVRALGGGLLLVGADASEARLGALPLADFGLLHFAAHAVNDEARPERSSVLLAAGDGSDGLLRAGEIAGLDLAGRTVVLASCRSASGSVLRGEGVMSLARAFFQAGAHGVVASLWPLRDDESALLFDRFYRHLARGETVAGALHAARREAAEAGEPAAAWAGLVVLGDGALAPLPGGRGWARRLVLPALLALALAAGVAAAWRLRRRPARG